MHIAMLLVPRMTQLDFTGPYEIFARSPGARVDLVWKDRTPVATEFGLSIVPTAVLADTKATDVLFVPGGVGVNALLTDTEVLDWLRALAPTSRYITSVCTGALVLGAAGLLQGKRATTHWSALDMLARFGATPVKARTVIDGNVVTGGGVTAGIDFGLTLAAELAGEEVAKSIQLTLEYDPQPPFDSGSPEKAGPERVKRLKERIHAMLEKRQKANDEAAARLA